MHLPAVFRFAGGPKSPEIDHYLLIAIRSQNDTLLGIRRAESILTIPPRIDPDRVPPSSKSKSPATMSIRRRSKVHFPDGSEPFRNRKDAMATTISGGANVGYQAELWRMADALRRSMDAAEYKHVVLGLIFLKYISAAFEAIHAELGAERDEGADPEDRDEYRRTSVFWVTRVSRWPQLKASAPQPTIGRLVDDAMTAVDRDNPSLNGVLPKDCARPGLDRERIGQLINLVSDIALGDPAERAKDTLGRVHEYFLSQFASAEGKNGGQFYTPSYLVRVPVETLAPTRGGSANPAAARAACS